MRRPQQRVTEEALELQETPLGGAKLMDQAPEAGQPQGAGPEPRRELESPHSTAQCPAQPLPRQLAGRAGRGHGEAPREAQLGWNRWQLRDHRGVFAET